jgi:hypothetical protein
MEVPRHLEPSLTAPSQTALSSPLDPLATMPSSPDSVGGTPAAGTDWGLFLKMSLAFATGQCCCCRPHSGQ